MQTFKKKITFFLLICLAFVGLQINAQTYKSKPNYLGQDNNVITTAVPFLLICPDSRAGGMGEAGVSSTPGVNSMHWNPAKYAFIKKDMGYSISYSPWLRNLVNDINLAYLTGYKRIDDKQAVAASLLYFSLGNITFTNISGERIGDYKPNEFSFDATYSRKLGLNWSGAVSLRWIHSNLTQGQFVGSAATKAGNSIATDVAAYYQNKIHIKNIQNSKFAFGVNISNIGSKISYSNDNTVKDFIPTNLRFGPSLTMDIDDYNQISFMIDINKLLVPTPPKYKLDSLGMPVVGPDGNQIIDKGMNNDVSVVRGIFQSFYDAPDGFKEEFHELSYALGVEYWYDKTFAMRTGFFYEDKTKGGRQFFTLGAGLKYNVFGLNFSYLIPTQQHNPLEHTLRFTLKFDFEAFTAQNKAAKQNKTTRLL